jgi:hypothetical protein
MSIGLGAATLDYGQLISAAAARRIACDCKIIPVVLGGEGKPLDVGRAQRTVPTGIRRALVARDGGCAFPGSAKPTTAGTGSTTASPQCTTRLLASCTVGSLRHGAISGFTEPS